MSALDEELALEEELKVARARSGLLAFTQQTFPGAYRVNWHHRAICRAVNFTLARKTPRDLLASFGIAGKELKRQLKNPHPVTKLYAGLTHPDAIDEPLRNVQVHVMPQVGKSQIISRMLPPFLLGRDADTRIICASYSAGLSRLMGRAVTQLMEDDAYQALFPKTKLAGNHSIETGDKGKRYVKNADLFEIVGRRGMYKNAGVGGSLTGHSADTLIIDDAVRNRADAESPVIRETLWNWYQTVALTRLSRDPNQFLINTRYHARDLSGATLAQAQANPKASQWFCLVFPAVLDCDPGPGDPRTKHGEALWPYKATTRQLEEIRSTMSAYNFDSLYQQRPAIMGGNIVKASWFKFYDRLPQDLRNFTLSGDLTFKDRGDYMVLQVWASKGSEHYLVDQIRDRLPFTGQLAAFKSLCQKYPQMRVKLIEEAANGAALIDTVKREIGGVIGVVPHGSKEMRLDAVSPFIEAGNVYLPSPARASWVDGFVEELTTVPSSAHDDQADACSLYLSRQAKRQAYTLASAPIAISGPSFADKDPSFDFGQNL